MNKDANVIFFGNVANNFYRVADILGSNGYSSVEVLISGNEDSTNLPSSDGSDPNLIANISNDWKLKYLFFTRRSRLSIKLAEADYVFFSSTNVLASLFTPRKVRKIFFATGADLTVFPFFFRNVYFRSLNQAKTIKNLFIIGIHSFFIAIAMRIALLKVDVIYAYPFAPFRNALLRLKVPRKKVSIDYLPVLLDTNKITFKSIALTEAGKLFQSLTKNSKLVIFCPSRIMVQDSFYHLTTGQYKGQDKVVRSFAKFIHSSKENEDSILVFIERDDDCNDRNKLVKLIDELSLKENIVWLRSSNGLFSRTELMEFYSQSDVILDEYGVGWFGSVSLEGMSCGRPVICHLDNAVMSKLYESNPFIDFSSESSLTQIFDKLHKDSSFVEQRGKISREWVIENHSKKRVLEFFANLD